MKSYNDNMKIRIEQLINEMTIEELKAAAIVGLTVSAKMMINTMQLITEATRRIKQDNGKEE